MTQATPIKLTKPVVDSAEPMGTRYHLWDCDLRGFGLRVETSGAKSFIVRYRAEGGGRNAPRRFMTVGRFGVLTVEQARKKAKELLAAATVGADPANKLKAKRAEMRMTALIDRYEEVGCFIQRGKRQGQPMKPLTKTLTLARLRHHVVPLLGHKRVTEVAAADIERFFRDVEAGKSAKDVKGGLRSRVIVRGGNGAARKVFRDLSAVFSFARRHNIVAVNPCETAVVDKTDNRRTRFLSLAELAMLGQACNELEAEGVNSKALNITRLWALTGCRRQEIAELKWSEVDFDKGLLRLADTKTGLSIRPLPQPAAALLHAIAPDPDSDYVFPADFGDSYFQGTKTIWPKIVKRANLPGVSPHTLRHTMGAMATSNGEALAMTGAILGHANMRSTMIYAHVEHGPSQKAADRVSRLIADALARSPDQTIEISGGADLVPRHGRANAPLPDAEWTLLLDIAEEPNDSGGFLAARDDPFLAKLMRRGLIQPGDVSNDTLARWTLTKAGARAVAEAT